MALVEDVLRDIGFSQELIDGVFAKPGATIPALFISTTRLLRGSPEEIECIIKECIKQAGNSGKYAVCPGCDLAPGTPEENIHAFINAFKRYGKFPINF